MDKKKSKYPYEHSSGALGAKIGRKLDIKEALRQQKEKPEIELKVEP